MNELELLIAAIAALLLLIIFLIVLMVRKRIPKKEKPIIKPELQKPSMQAEENKLANKPIEIAEPRKEPLQEQTAKEALSALTSGITVEPQINSTSDPAPKAGHHENLPQDFMLRRHYLSHLRTMIECLNPPTPSLSSQYDDMVKTNLDRCLSDKVAMEKLLCAYAEYKKALTQPIQEPKTSVEPLHNTERGSGNATALPEKIKLPEDSMLKRHAITQLYFMIESNMPLRPTDSVLRRHYDTMVNTEVKKLIS